MGAGIASAPAPVAARPVESSARTMDFAIPEQSLAEALRAFALQAGRQIVFYSNDAERLRAGPLSGRLTEREALARILQGSGLEFVYLNERTIGIGRRGADGRFISGLPDAPAGEATDDGLAEIRSGPRVILVTGRLLDAELSTEAKREADQIVDVLTSDEASQLPDKNIAESLARIPGVSVIRNGETGDGAFISIRGLDSALSNVQFNGVNTGHANGINRSVPLEGITSDNIKEIRVVKSLLPADEGVGIGGSVNIISRTPLTGGRDQILFDGSVRYGEFSERLGFDAGFNLTRIFSDAFGVNLAASFRRRHIENFEVDASNSYVREIRGLEDAGGRFVGAAELFALGLTSPDDFRNFNPGAFSPEDIVFEQHSYQAQEQRRDTLSLSGAIDWRPGDSTLLTLSGRYSRNVTDGFEWDIGFDEDGLDYALAGDRLVAQWEDFELDYNAQVERSTDLNATLLLKGVTETGPLNVTYQASYALAESVNPQTDIVFTSLDRFDRGREQPLTNHPWTFEDSFFPVPDRRLLDDPELAAGLRDLPSIQELSAFRDFEITNRNDRYAGRIDLAYRADAGLLGGTLDGIALGAKVERSDVYTFFDYFQGSATRLNADGTFNGPNPPNGNAVGTLLRDMPTLRLGSAGLGPIGSPLAAIGIEAIPTLDKRDWTAFANRFRETFLAADYPYLSRDFFDSREDTVAGYVQFDYRAGPLRLVAGVRAEHYEGAFSTPLSFTGNVVLNAEGEDPRTLELSQPGVTLDTLTTTARNTEWLPRMTASYDVTDRFRIRAGAGYALARPSYLDLGSASSVSIGLQAEDPSGGIILPGVSTVEEAVAAGGLDPSQVREVSIGVSSGNPDLENARALNLDLSFEYYPVRGTALSLGLFYKKIENFIFLGFQSRGGSLDPAFVGSFLSPAGAALLDGLGGIAALTDPAYDPTITVSRPENGRTATLRGLELGVTHRFDWAPGPLRNLGFSGNATYLDSDSEFFVSHSLDADEALVVLGFNDEGDALVRRSTFFRAPKYSGNASLFYDDGAFEAAVSATYQSESLAAVDDFGLDQFTAAYTQLDVFMGYMVPLGSGEVKVFFEVADILDGGTKATDLQTVGRERIAFDEASFNGREFRLGFRTRF